MLQVRLAVAPPLGAVRLQCTAVSEYVGQCKAKVLVAYIMKPKARGRRITSGRGPEGDVRLHAAVAPPLNAS